MYGWNQPLFQSLLASRALKTWHHSGVDESKKEACCQCYLPTCYGLHNPPLPHAPDIKLSTMTPWITTTLAPIFTRYNWYNLLLSLFHEFPLLKPHQEAGRLASLPPTPPVHCNYDVTSCVNISNEFIPSFNGLLSDFSTGRPTCHKEVNQTNTYR